MNRQVKYAQEVTWGFEDLEVFKTSVADKEKAKNLVDGLHNHFPSVKFNFDLWDCDKILRAEGVQLDREAVMRWMNARGYVCEPLPN